MFFIFYKKIKGSYIFQFYKDTLVYCADCNTYTHINKKEKSKQCMKCKKEIGIILKENKLIKVENGLYETKREKKIEVKKKSFYFTISYKKIKIKNKRVYQKEIISKIKFTRSDIMIQLLKYYDDLFKDDLALILQGYNQIVPKDKQIYIYDIHKIDKYMFYSLFIHMYEYSKLANIQSYFEENVLINIYNLNLYREMEKFSLNEKSLLSYISRNTNDNYIYKRVDVDKDKVHQMLGISKFLLKYLKNHHILRNTDDYSFSKLVYYRELELYWKKYTPHALKSFRNDYYAFSYFKDLYNHNEIKEYRPIDLLFYLEKQLKIHNDMYIYPGDLKTIIFLLGDFIKMRNEVEIPLDKLPKNLSEEHDMLTEYYEAYSYDKKVNEENDNKLKKVIEAYDKDYQNTTFAICKPSTVLDFYKEGSSLNHCVFSYVDEVLKGEKQIYFLRRTKQPNKPLITIEYNPFKNRVIQASGNYNRKLNKEEETFLNEWKQHYKIH